ncbi:MAG: methenyltetrahydromethanopterin cyclohydrolase [Gammaproteobacteria bacterium]|nr:methenyltetrahydromethanopterin cyclohydrolase [Gammaproteobacteria bacterium]MCK5668299.1 methenyltetrahydromethanopterin cyclohydrolase [Gammaproteobacteria bacterium]
MSQNQDYPSVNKLAEPLVRKLKENIDSLRLSVSRLENGTAIVDAGIQVPGGLEAGCRIAEICMGGLGSVTLRSTTNLRDNWSWHVDVHSSHSVIACLASQYAGWKLSSGDFNALGSGPGRAMGSKEPLFEELEYRDKTDTACLVIESDIMPPIEVAEDIAEHCDISPNKLTLIMTPTSSLSGCVQIVSRVLETALHKVHALEFDVTQVTDGAGSAPICPPSPDFMTAMGRTNDAILFSGQVHLFVDANDSDTEQLANQLPSSTSKDYGKPFGEIFKDVNYDFYKIDPMLFSPARVSVSSIKTGHTFHAGKLDKDLLDKSFSN